MAWSPLEGAVIHDHGGCDSSGPWCTHHAPTRPSSSAPFAIMKFRSGVRIVADDRVSRAGNAGPSGRARPGTADPAARAGHLLFPKATTVRTASDRAVSRTGMSSSQTTHRHTDVCRGGVSSGRGGPDGWRGTACRRLGAALRPDAPERAGPPLAWIRRAENVSAEGVGFEPTRTLTRPSGLKRPPPSATRRTLLAARRPSRPGERTFS